MAVRRRQNCSFGVVSVYILIVRPDLFHLGKEAALIVVFVFAVLQAMVQLLFFINLWKEERPRWNLVFFISTVLTIIIVVALSIWIMKNLDYRMMM